MCSGLQQAMQRLWGRLMGWNDHAMGPGYEESEEEMDIFYVEPPKDNTRSGAIIDSMYRLCRPDGSVVGYFYGPHEAETCADALQVEREQAFPRAKGKS